MKTFNKILAVAVMIGALALAEPKAEAQLGFDAYGLMDTVVLQPPLEVSVASLVLVGAGVSGATNSPAVDVFALTGLAAVDLSFVTNNALGVGGTMTATPQQSPDNTNWYSLTNYSLATPYTATYTNQFYGNASNLTCQTTYNLNGVPSTPVAYSAGYATPGLTENQFTNQGTITCTPGVVQTFGWHVNDQGRYVRILWTAGGTLTNGVIQAMIHSPYRVHY